jgi:hypothetical protein
MESTVSLAKLVLPTQIKRRYDPDAAAYIANVEAADGQSLEQGVKDAITDFVVECKTTGIWNSIKSCCLLCGARTIAGATVPLKGNAPILTSFVGNYSRENGLRRTSGSYSFNRNNNADPQNSKHIAVYPTSIDYGSSDSNFRAIIGSVTISGSTFITVNSLGLAARANTSTNLVSNQPVFANSLIGISIFNDSQSQLSYSNNLSILNISTTTPANSDLLLFSGAGVSPSAGRVAFYSVGESLNLQILNNLIKTLRQKILRTLSTYSVIDNDALNYIKRVETADDFVLENSVKQAIDNFILGLKNDNTWSAIKASCIMCGARTINGALVPLVGLPPINFNFTHDDSYIRSLGLIGINNGFRFLDSRRRNDEDPQNNNHRAVYKSVAGMIANVYIGSSNTDGQDSIGARGQLPNVLMAASRLAVNGTIDTPQNFNTQVGLIAIARNNNLNYEVVGGGSATTISATSLTPSSSNIAIFARPGGGSNSNIAARLSFYSIGEYLNLSTLNSRVATLMTALSNAGI